MFSACSDYEGCQMLEDRTSLHNRRAIPHSDDPYEWNQKKFGLVDSTNDSTIDNEKIAYSGPREQQMKVIVVADLESAEQEEDDDNEVEEKSAISVSTLPRKIIAKSIKKRGARPKQGKEVDTFFPKMRSSIIQEVQCLNDLPQTITFKTFPSVIYHFAYSVEKFLKQQIERDPPSNMTAIKMRKKARQQQMFKNRAQQIWDEYFVPIRQVPK